MPINTETLRRAKLALAPTEEIAPPPDMDPMQGGDPAAAMAGAPGGEQVDPETGLPIDPQSGLPMDPETGLLVDVQNQQLIDPQTGQPVDPAMLEGGPGAEQPGMDMEVIEAIFQGLDMIYMEVQQTRKVLDAITKSLNLQVPLGESIPTGEELASAAQSSAIKTSDENLAQDGDAAEIPEGVTSQGLSRADRIVAAFQRYGAR